MTEDENNSPRSYVLTPETGCLEVTGDQAELIIEASAAATTSLSRAVSSATATGHHDIAKAANIVNITIINNIHTSADNTGLTINKEFTRQVQEDVTKLEEALQTNVPLFDCKKAMDNCLGEASTLFAQVHCWLLYIGCIGSHISSALKPFAD